MKSADRKSPTYDVAIVGAGPAGMFAAYELINKSPKLKIALIDMGNRVEKRSSKDVMSGFGGAGTYSDGKLHFSPVLSHERTFHLITPDNYQKLLDKIDSIFKTFDVDSVEYPSNWDDVRPFIEEAQRNEMQLIVRRLKHVGTDILKKFVLNFENYLEKKGVKILCNTEVTDLIVEKKKCCGLITSSGIIKSKAYLLSPGRISTRWLQTLGDKRGIEYEYGMVEVGVRVEFPEAIMRRLSDALYEPALKIRTETFDDIVRTFCPCPRGFVAKETYENYVCVNGHSTSKHDSLNSNFAFLVEVHLTEPVENSIMYAQSIAQLATTIGGGKPILQRLADLKKGRRSTWGRISKSLVIPSLKDVTPGDIAMVLPHRIVTDILEGLTRLDKIMPGINSGSTLLYAPEVKLRSSRVKTNKYMETTLKNVYVAGDASGMSGSITGAAATGLMAAKGIVKGIK